MKNTHYIILICLLIVGLGSTLFLYKKPMAEERFISAMDKLATEDSRREEDMTKEMESEAENGLFKMLYEDEVYTRLEDEKKRIAQKQGEIGMAYEKYLLDKYAGWTEEKVKQRLQELDPSEVIDGVRWIREPEPSSEAGREWKELYDYGIAKYNVAPGFGKDTLVIFPYDAKEELETLGQAYRAADWVQSLMYIAITKKGSGPLMLAFRQLVDMRGKDIRFLPQTSEYWSLQHEITKDMNKPGLITDEELEAITQLLKTNQILIDFHNQR